jgi:hypothetical protein
VGGCLDLQLHQIEQIGAAGEICAGRARHAAAAAPALGALVVGEGLHALLRQLPPSLRIFE